MQAALCLRARMQMEALVLCPFVLQRLPAPISAHGAGALHRAQEPGFKGKTTFPNTRCLQN